MAGEDTEQLQIRVKSTPFSIKQLCEASGLQALKKQHFYIEDI